MKALARYQIILLGEQRHIGVNNLPKVVARQCSGRELNPRFAHRESNALVYRPSSKKPNVSYQIGSWWILAKYASIAGVVLLIWCHTFKMVAMTSFHADTCCRLVSHHEASSWRLCSSFDSSWSIVHSYLLLIFKCVLTENSAKLCCLCCVITGKVKQRYSAGFVLPERNS